MSTEHGAGIGALKQVAIDAKKCVLAICIADNASQIILLR